MADLHKRSIQNGDLFLFVVSSPMEVLSLSSGTYNTQELPSGIRVDGNP